MKDAKDWRAHLEQMGEQERKMKETLGPAGAALARLADDIAKNLDKVNAREKYLNSQLEGLLAQFRYALSPLGHEKKENRFHLCDVFGTAFLC